MATDPRSVEKNAEQLNLLECTYADFLNRFQTLTSRGDFFARPLYRQVMKDGLYDPSSLPEFKASPKTLEKILPVITLPLLKLENLLNSSGVEKLLFKTQDGHVIESVLIPMGTRETLCISSQIGCRMNCLFCKTGKMGLVRNLSPGEIVSQLYYVKFIKKRPVRNVVFMGMGEPLDNLNSVLKAIDVFTDDFGFNMKRTNITLSTCGLLPGIERLAREAARKCVLAVSLNAADDKVRSHLMPVNVKYPLPQLKTLLMSYPLPKNGAVFLEYVLIRGMNDSSEDARTLIKYVEGLKIRINLIPYNPGSCLDFHPPHPKDIERFHHLLKKAGIHVLLRKEKGGGIMAACGQLGGKAGI